MERFRSADRMRPAVAGRVLCRCVPVLRRALHADDELRLAARADPGECGRHCHHDDGRLLHFVVEAAGQATAEIGGAKATGTQTRLIGPADSVTASTAASLQKQAPALRTPAFR